jgi:hypothetical protein
VKFGASDRHVVCSAFVNVAKWRRESWVLRIGNLRVFREKAWPSVCEGRIGKVTEYAFSVLLNERYTFQCSKP